MTKLKKAMGTISGGEGGGNFSSLGLGSESDSLRRGGNRNVGGHPVPNSDLGVESASPQSLGSLMVQLGGLGEHHHPGAVPWAGGGRRQAVPAASTMSEHEEGDESDDEEMLAISEPVYYAGYIWVGEEPQIMHTGTETQVTSLKKGLSLPIKGI